MELRQLTPELSVSPQITADDVAALKVAGFRAIVCSRPDGEGAGQLLFSEIERAARLAGLEKSIRCRSAPS
jgi:sulfide:quinone oxidoreductase